MISDNTSSAVITLRFNLKLPGLNHIVVFLEVAISNLRFCSYCSTKNGTPFKGNVPPIITVEIFLSFVSILNSAFESWHNPIAGNIIDHEIKYCTKMTKKVLGDVN